MVGVAAERLVAPVSDHMSGGDGAVHEHPGDSVRECRATKPAHGAVGATLRAAPDPAASVLGVEPTTPKPEGSFPLLRGHVPRPRDRVHRLSLSASTQFVVTQEHPAQLRYDSVPMIQLRSALLGVTLFACSSAASTATPDAGDSCTPGVVTTCACDGRGGTQTCLASGHPGGCNCDAVPRDSGSDPPDSDVPDADLDAPADVDAAPPPGFNSSCDPTKPSPTQCPTVNAGGGTVPQKTFCYAQHTAVPHDLYGHCVFECVGIAAPYQTCLALGFTCDRLESTPVDTCYPH